MNIRKFIRSLLENPALKCRNEGSSVSTHSRLRPLGRSSRRLIILGMVACLSMAGAQVFAEVYGQKQGLFWIDVSSGWRCSEDTERVILVSRSGHRKIQIDIVRMDGIKSDGDAEQLVRATMALKVRDVVSKNGKTIMSVERKIDGAFALQNSFLISSSEGMKQATAVTFFRSRNLFNIYFEASREFQRMEMEKIVDTIRFKAPVPKKKKAAESPEAGSSGKQSSPVPEAAN